MKSPETGTAPVTPACARGTAGHPGPAAAWIPGGPAQSQHCHLWPRRCRAQALVVPGYLATEHAT
jgi:hypothetical protein